MDDLYRGTLLDGPLRRDLDMLIGAAWAAMLVILLFGLIWDVHLRKLVRERAE